MLYFERLELHFTLIDWASLIAITALGGFMRGFAGFGTTLVMVPIFILFMPPVEAVLIGLTIDVIAMVPMFPSAAKDSDWNELCQYL